MGCYNSELPIGPPRPTGPQGPSGLSTINVQQAAPTTANDVSEGYVVGSTWFDETTSKFYICSDATVGAAVWDLIGGLSGSWSGTVTANITGTTTFINNSGRYSTNGNIVTCSCKLQTTIVASASSSFSLSLPIPPSALFNDNLRLTGVGSLTNTSSTGILVTRLYGESRPGQLLAAVVIETDTLNSDSFTYNLVIQYTI
jgi:hypothetical protein